MKNYLSTGGKTSSVRPMLIAVAASFLLGGALVGYTVYTMTDKEPVANDQLAVQPSPSAVPDLPAPSPSALPTGADTAANAVQEVKEQQGGIDQRLAAAEQRLARLDLQAQAASGNAARAEGLLIAFATRRALEKGTDLGYLADQLRLRFGDAKPNAVNLIISASKDPITLDQLIARLEGLAPKLAEHSDKPGFERFRDELAQLFVIRRESSPSPQPQRRLERARLFLESGRTEAAIAEVKNLPGADNAKAWIHDAERYAAVQQALELLETSAVLEPRLLRDSEGRRIEQPGPGDNGDD